MQLNETLREILRSLLYIGLVPLIAGMLFLYIWLGEEVRQAAVDLEELKRVEMKLRGDQNYLRSEQKRLHRPDHLAELATSRLELVQPDPQPREVHVVLP